MPDAIKEKEPVTAPDHPLPFTKEAGDEEATTVGQYIPDAAADEVAHVERNPMAAVKEEEDKEAAPEDPIVAFDQPEFDKATNKVDPHHRMPVSSVPKGGIKPSGKKPLW